MGKMTIENLKFIGKDLVLMENNGLDCYSLDQLCCDENRKENPIECQLKEGNTAFLQSKLQFQRIEGLFHLFGVFSDNLGEINSYPIKKSPELELKNTEFFGFSLINGGWQSLIRLGDIGFTLKIVNFTMSNSFFQYGILCYISLDEDPYFSYIFANKTQEFIGNFSGNFTIQLSHAIIENYDEFSFLDENGDSVNVMSLLNFDNSVLINPVVFEFENLQIYNSDINYPIFILTMSNSSLNLDANTSVLFRNLSFRNNTNIFLAKVRYLNLYIENLELSDIHINNQTRFFIEGNQSEIKVNLAIATDCNFGNRFAGFSFSNFSLIDVYLERICDIFFEISGSLEFENFNYKNSNVSVGFLFMDNSTVFAMKNCTFSQIYHSGSEQSFMKIMDTINISVKTSFFEYLSMKKQDFLAITSAIVFTVEFSGNLFVSCQSVTIQIFGPSKPTLFSSILFRKNIFRNLTSKGSEIFLRVNKTRTELSGNYYERFIGLSFECIQSIFSVISNNFYEIETLFIPFVYNRPFQPNSTILVDQNRFFYPKNLGFATFCSIIVISNNIFLDCFLQNFNLVSVAYYPLNFEGNLVWNLTLIFISIFSFFSQDTFVKSNILHDLKFDSSIFTVIQANIFLYDNIMREFCILATFYHCLFFSTMTNELFLSNMIVSGLLLTENPEFDQSQLTIVSSFTENNFDRMYFENLVFEDVQKFKFIEIFYMFESIEIHNVSLRNCSNVDTAIIKIMPFTKKSNILSISSFFIENFTCNGLFPSDSEFAIIQISSCASVNLTTLSVSNLSFSNPNYTLLLSISDCQTISISSSYLEINQILAFRILIQIDISSENPFFFINNSVYSPDFSENTMALSLSNIRTLVLENNLFNNIKICVFLQFLRFFPSVLSAKNNIFLNIGNSIYATYPSKCHIFDTKITNKTGISDFAAIHIKTNGEILIKGAIFWNIEGIMGSCIQIWASPNESIEIYDILGGNCWAETLAGFLFVFGAGKLKLERLSIKNATSLGAAGSIHLEFIGNCSISQIRIEDSTSTKNGGFLDLEYVNLTISDIEIIESAAVGDFNADITGSGGAISMVGTLSSLNLSEASIISANCLGQGSAIFAENPLFLAIYNTSIRDSWNRDPILRELTLGVIYLSGYSEVTLEYPSFLVLKNVTFQNNFAKVGCLYYDSNFNATFEDITVVNVSGLAFRLESDGTGKAAMARISIFHEEVFQEVYSLDSGYFSFGNLEKLIFKDLFAKGNFSKRLPFIELRESGVLIENSLLFDVFSPIIVKITGNSAVFRNFSIQYKDFSNDLKDFLFLSIENSEKIDILGGVFQNAFSKSPSFHVFSNIAECTIESSIFKDLEPSSSIISVLNTNFSIKSTKFILFANAFTLYFKRNSLFLGNCSFFATGLELISGNITMIKEAESIEIIDSEFRVDQNQGNSNMLRAANVDKTANIHLKNSNFSGFHANSGSVFTITNAFTTISTVLVNSSAFQNNSASLGGVFYFKGNLSISLLSSVFIMNQALNGTVLGKGGVFIADFQNYHDDSDITILQSFFSENRAEYMGSVGLINGWDANVRIEGNHFQNNRDFLNFTDSVSFPSFKQFVVSSSYISDPINFNFSLNNSNKTLSLLNKYSNDKITIASGQAFSFSVFLTDFSNQRLLFLNSAKAFLECFSFDDSKTTSLSSIAVDHNSSQSINGVLSFESVKIITKPTSFLQCNIIISLDYNEFLGDTFNGIFSLNLQIFLRNCSRGEIYQEDESCYQCLEKTFQVLDPMNKRLKSSECSPCPANAICTGGSAILPNPGYWRSSENSSLVLLCPTEESCQGSIYLQQKMPVFNESDQEVIQGKCHWKYGGNLCYECIHGFGRVHDSGICESCTTQLWPYFKIVVGFLFIIIYIAGQAKTYASLRVENTTLAILIKLFLNHFQILSMVSITDLGWTEEFSSFFQFQDFFSCVYQDFFTIDCLVQDINENLMAEKLVFTIILPVILSLCMLVFWLIDFVLHARASDRESAKSRLASNSRVTFLAIIFILYPEILKKSFTVLNCQLIDDSIDLMVLKSSPNVVCWKDKHLLWTMGIAFPGIIIWGVFTPVFLLIVLRYFREQIKKERDSTKEVEQVGEVRGSKQWDVLNRRCVLFVDSEFQQKYLQEYNLPFFQKRTYQLKNQVIREFIEIRESKDFIAEAEAEKRPLEIPSVKASTQNEQSNNLENDVIIADSIEILSEFLELMEYNKFREIPQDFLRAHPVTVRISSSKDSEKRTTRRGIREQSSISSPELQKWSRTLKKPSKIMTGSSFLISNLGFIYKGYSQDCYYWEIVLFSRKFLLILIGVFTEFFPKETRDINLIVILMFYFVAQLRNAPFEEDFLNKLEKMSISIAILTSFVGIFLYNSVVKKAGVFLLVLVFGSNAFYVGTWGYYVWRNGGVRKIRRYFGKILNWKRQKKKNIGREKK